MKALAVVTVIISLLVFTNCKQQPDVEKCKEEIIRTEADFAAMADEKGIREAFVFYADSSAVLKRGETLIIGREAMEKHFSAVEASPVKSLAWKPGFVDVAASGDLGYTYGTFKMGMADSTGEINYYEGVFHTVWKRQANGEWRYVWD